MIPAPSLIQGHLRADYRSLVPLHLCLVIRLLSTEGSLYLVLRKYWETKFEHSISPPFPLPLPTPATFPRLVSLNMPLYDIEHTTPLSDSQQERLAVLFTGIHATRFKTPKFFVNVRYTDASKQVVFRGGKRVVYNRVVLRTRVGEQRSKDLYDLHCRDLVRAWEEVVGKSEEGRELRTVWVLGALTTAVECGIARPKVGTRCLGDPRFLLLAFHSCDGFPLSGPPRRGFDPKEVPLLARRCLGFYYV
jgi:hypothetical protein